jgi:Lon protease-like protein
VTALGYRKIADLPQTVALFPLTGAILFPRGGLPLNVFEPRYLNMVDDALADDRLIAMVQPAFTGVDDALADVGTLGKITSFTETEDGRYLITLTGVCRFRLEREVPGATPYRRAVADYEQFAADLLEPRTQIDREKLRHALARYIDTHGYQADWSAVDEAPGEALVNAVSTMCPFDPPAKQALLEAPTLADRCDALIALLEWGADEEDGPRGPLQ